MGEDMWRLFILLLYAENWHPFLRPFLKSHGPFSKRKLILARLLAVSFMRSSGVQHTERKNAARVKVSFFLGREKMDLPGGYLLAGQGTFFSSVDRMHTP